MSRVPISQACRNWRSIDVWIRAKILQDFLPLLFVNEQIHALFVMTSFQPALSAQELGVVLLPIFVRFRLASAAELLLADRAESFEQFILQRQEELVAPR